MENENVPPSIIGQRLREERERLKLGVLDFAMATGVSDRSQRNYETGKRLPDLEYLARAKELDIDIDYVITGERSNWRSFSEEVEHQCDMMEAVVLTLEEALQREGLTLEPAQKARCARVLFRTGLYGAPVNHAVAAELLRMFRA